MAFCLLINLIVFKLIAYIYLSVIYFYVLFLLHISSFTNLWGNILLRVNFIVIYKNKKYKKANMNIHINVGYYIDTNK